MNPLDSTEEARRLADRPARWRLWGPYLSERQWGTVREDYSADGDAWNFLPHEQARSRAYRWGEDGIGGFADDRLNLCLSVAMWNGRDPVLKERLFGLTNAEGNHGEDVKEHYHYLDGVPSHAYMRMLYKYPQAAYPYDELVRVNGQRGLHEREYELMDTGVFDQDRYFDIEIEYAKAAPDDIVLSITATNRGPDAATLHLLPQLYARNKWSWKPGRTKPRLVAEGDAIVRCEHPDLPPMSLHCEGTPTLLFCDNETNRRRYGEPEAAGYFKDAINDWLVAGDAGAVNPQRFGTKVAALYRLEVAAGASTTVRVLLGPTATALPTQTWAQIVAARRAEADAYYAALQAGVDDEDRRRVQRQALAGMLWSKQFYHFDVREWLAGDPLQPVPPAARNDGRNADWGHLTNGEVLSVPDTWEYPWYAAWDLAFHCVTYTMVDPAFAKAQLVLLTQSRYMHPNGQLPAYEWAFGDANPPVHAWAALQIYELDRQRSGVGDTAFLERMFHKLMLNFTWWVNRKDSEGRNIFQGGFLGLDNIGLFDRSKQLPTGGTLDQSDGTAWVSMYALNLMRMALELAMQQPVYEDLATKFFEHFLYIAEAVHAIGGTQSTGLWDDLDGFYYDVLRRPGLPDVPLRVRSMVGLIPLFAVEVLHDEVAAAQPAFRARLEWFLEHRPDLAELVSHFTGKSRFEYRLLSLMRRDRLTRVLARLLDEDEFLSPYGIRSLSKYHAEHPTVFAEHDAEFTVRYTPAESETRAFGGNSNWRGPIWFPVNMLIIQALHRYHTFYGDELQIEYPTRSGRRYSLREIAEQLSERVIGLFLRGADGTRPYLGDAAKQQLDPHFRDHLLFYEYFDGDNGRGCGASHQTGWTGLIAMLLQPSAERDTAAASADAAPVTTPPERPANN
jgi:Glycosyl hydrolase family 63 C-terminal domain